MTLGLYHFRAAAQVLYTDRATRKRMYRLNFQPSRAPPKSLPSESEWSGWLQDIWNANAQTDYQTRCKVIVQGSKCVSSLFRHHYSARALILLVILLRCHFVMISVVPRDALE